MRGRVATLDGPPGSWLDLTRRARQKFLAGHFADALDLCDLALAAVAGLSNAAPLTEPAFTARQASHRNRATVLAKLERVEEADAEWRAALAFARRVLHDHGHPPALRVAACRHCVLARAERAAWIGAQG